MKATRMFERTKELIAGGGGFTLAEVMIVAAISVVVVMSVVVAYVGTARSWNGTTGLLNIQREASLGVEVIQNAVRPASSLTVSSGVNGDSLEVYYSVASGDSLAAEFYMDDAGNLLDINGATVSSNLDSIHFTVVGSQLHINAWHRSDAGTPNRATDDQAVEIFSTVSCRN